MLLFKLRRVPGLFYELKISISCALCLILNSFNETVSKTAIRLFQLHIFIVSVGNKRLLKRREAVKHEHKLNQSLQ